MEPVTQFAGGRWSGYLYLLVLTASALLQCRGCRASSTASILQSQSILDSLFMGHIEVKDFENLISRMIGKLQEWTQLVFYIQCRIGETLKGASFQISGIPWLRIHNCEISGYNYYVQWNWRKTENTTFVRKVTAVTKLVVIYDDVQGADCMEYVFGAVNSHARLPTT